MRRVNDEAAAILEQRMQDTFGYGHAEYRMPEHGRAPVPNAYLNNAIRIVERSGVLESLQRWRGEDHASSGRKPVISWRAVLVLFLLHIQSRVGVDYEKIAGTIMFHLTPQQFDLLGIAHVPGGEDQWYHRLWRAANRMMKVLDPYPVNHKRRLEPKEYQAFRQHLESDEGKRITERNLARLDHMMEQLVHASVRLLPKDIWDRYEGNVAIDATFVETSGGLNPMDPKLNRGSADPYAGRYRREGDHDGFGAKTDKGGYELDNGAMTWSRPGRPHCFPHSRRASASTGRERSAARVPSWSSLTNVLGSRAVWLLPTERTTTPFRSISSCRCV